MELQLRTITPIHIGNGDDLHTLDYVVHGDRFYHMPQQKFFQFLSGLGPGAATEFADWTVEIANKIETVEDRKRNSPKSSGMDYNQELSKLRQSFTYIAFARKIGKDKEFLQFLKSHVAGLPIGNPRQIRQQIRSLLKSGDGKAYLPGSSIKGAIRTALLFNVLENKMDVKEVEKVLQFDLDEMKKDKAFAKKENKKFSLDRWKKKFGEALEHKAFYCPFTNSKGKEVIGEERFDVLKFLIVTDGQLSEQALRVDNVDIFLVKKLPKGKLEAQSQKQAPGMESIEADVKSSVQLKFNIDAVWGIAQSLKDGVVKDKDGISWIGFTEKIRQVYGIDATQINKDNKDLLCEEVEKNVMEAVRKFSEKQLEKDEKWLKRFKDHDVGKSFSLPVEAGFQQIRKRKAGVLLHFGYATGFNGTTEALYLVDKFKPLYKLIMEEFGIGDSPTAGKNRKPGERYVANPDEFPKSRRLISRPDIIMPPGWVEVVNLSPAADSSEDTSTGSANVVKVPAKPAYPSGKIRQNTELDAEVIASGMPNKIKLFISEDKQPVIDFKYGMGFGPEKIGRIIIVAVTGLNGSGDVVSVRYVGEK